MSFYSKFSDKESLLAKAESLIFSSPVKVNAHLHTPYSFSAFNHIDQALDMAVAENVKVVGINDFYSTNGYGEWAEGCSKRHLFPLFNIEFISLNRNDQANNIRVNDPNNPGRTYLSGKGLAFPQILKEPYLSQLNTVCKESNTHVAAMCVKLNEILDASGAAFSLSYNEIKEDLTRGIVRERHLAKALRQTVKIKFRNPQIQKTFYEIIFGGKALKSDLENFADVENEIRGNLLKAGGRAFVAENPKAFLDMEVVCQIILNAGGIPTYPFLADDAKGEFTDFECDKQKVAQILQARGIHSIEFITTRNSLEVLEDYAKFFYNQGFVVTFGSEHNTPAMEPLELFARNKAPLSPLLMDINLKGASVVAAHQYLFATEGKGYVDTLGKPDIANRNKYEKIGRALIEEA